MGPLRLAQPMTATLPSHRARPWITVADGQLIRELRHQCGLAQAELVDRAEVSAHTIGRLERRHRTGCRTRTLDPDRRRARRASHGDSCRHSDGPRDTE